MENAEKRFVVHKGQTAQFYMSIGTREEKGLFRVMNHVCDDIRLVTGIRPDIRQIDKDNLDTLTNQDNRPKVIAGTYNDSPLVEYLIVKYQLPVQELIGKRECYRYYVIDTENMSQPFLCIVGSDRLGTFYGLYHLSKMCGVSPWVYWADALPAQKSELEFTYDELNIQSKEPSVRLRGFFMNDEWPSLGAYVTNTFGDFNEEFYDKVFDLLLRLKGNFLWPAMWSASFPCDGKKNPLANVQLADELGITMGTSHHEPMMRASEEWDKVKSYSNMDGYGRDWSFLTNERGLNQYWADAVIRSGNYKNLITLGMRGERDSKVLSEHATLRQNIDLLVKVIQSQKHILQGYRHESEPKVLALYKEVEDYYYGNEETEGLKHSDLLNDVLLLLSDDNFGNTRSLPEEETKDRKAGWGLYYHLDYHGAPVSYEWINSTPLNKIWEQMTQAYEFGIRDLWIVNVGDIRPQELPLSYFMELAFDYERLGTGALNKTEEFTKRWVSQLFGGFVEEKVQKQIVWVVSEYTRMNGQRKPEVMSAETFHLYHEREAARMLLRAIHLEEKVRELQQMIPVQRRDTYFGIVAFPALATANLWKMQIYTGYYQYFAEDGCLLCNQFAKQVQDCIMTDRRLEHEYNFTMSDGKWRGMMSSAHVGFTHWNEEGWSYPQTPKVVKEEENRFFVYIQNEREPVSSGRFKLSFSNLEQERYWILLTDNLEGAFKYSIEGLPDCLHITRQECLPRAVLLELSVDFTKVETDKSVRFWIRHGMDNVLAECQLNVYSTRKLKENTYVETKEVVSMESIHYASQTPDTSQTNVVWSSLLEYGKSHGTVKVIPPDYQTEDVFKAPVLLYRFQIHHEGDYTFTFRLLPSNPVDQTNRIRFGAALDELPVQIYDTIPDGYASGDYNDDNWCTAVLRNERIFKKGCYLTRGVHELHIYGIDPAFGLEKIEIAKRPSDTFFGYPETYRFH